MKKLLSILLISGIITNTGYTQTVDRDPAFFGLTVNTDNKNVYLQWQGSSSVDSYWIVEGGKREDEMQVIGYVMGADPKMGLRFKQELARMTKGLKYFRVVEMNAERPVAASGVVSVSK